MGAEITFRELANKLAGELPSGWEVRIQIGRDGGSVSLIDPEGEEEDLDIDGDIAGTVLWALEKAKRAEAWQHTDEEG
jgi:hypothetical protein